MYDTWDEAQEGFIEGSLMTDDDYARTIVRILRKATEGTPIIGDNLENWFIKHVKTKGENK